MEKKLNEFSVGERGVVVRIEGEGQVYRRLLDMGITPGAEIVLRKLAPLGDPVEVTLRGYELTLRKAEAASVVMRSEGVATQPALSEKDAKKAKKQADKAAKKAEKLAAKEAKGGKK